LTLRPVERTIPPVNPRKSEEPAQQPSADPTETDRRTISRRQFGRDAAIAAAATLGGPALLAASAGGVEAASREQGKPEPLKGLTPQQVADVDAKLANILRKYGDRFTAGQKAHLRRILAQNERLLAPVRAFSLENGDPPASVVRLRFDAAAGSSAEKSEG
jgi:hypothetical protein